MNEVYDAVNNGVMFLIWIVQGYCLQYFDGSFLESRGQGRARNSFCVAALYIALKLCLSLCLPSEYGDKRTIEAHFIMFFGLAAAALFFYKAVKAVTGFLVVTFMAVCEISVFCACIVGEIYFPVMDFWNWCMGKGYIHSASLFENLQIVTYIVAQMLLCVVAAALPVVVFRKIVRSFREKDYAIGRTELLFLLAPGMVSLLICILLQTYLCIENGQIYMVSPLLLVIIPAILFLCLLFILSDVRLFQDMIDRNREKSSRIILEKQVDSMQEHIAEMDRMYSGIRGMKHDMKNSLTVIMQLADSGSNEELRDYLSGLSQTFDRLEFQYKTGNAVVDTLLNTKYHEIMNTLPDLQFHADKLLFPEKLMIQSYDIGIILGNALDNALEACKKLKAEEPEAEIFILLSSYARGKMFFLEMENSFDGKVVRKRDAEFPITTKADKKVHGIGLFNIKHTAEKYHGAVDWSIGHNVFTLSVMLKNEKGI